MLLRTMMSGAAVLAAVVGASVRAGAPAADARPVRDTHENLHAVLWMQTSAEYQAITRGIYRQAVAQLDRALADPRWTAIPEQSGRSDLPTLPPAVIMDVDETVLDNSPAEGRRVLDRVRYEPELFACPCLQLRRVIVPRFHGDAVQICDHFTRR